MYQIPDTILIEIFSYLPHASFLPVAHVSKKFRTKWLDCRKINSLADDCDQDSTQAEEICLTSPLQKGNLFDSPWNTRNPTPLHTNLLDYYVSCGWNGRWIEVMRGAAARGDIQGMSLLLDRRWIHIDNVDMIDMYTIAGAAGHVKALKWLREERSCPWDSVEVYREASENLHNDVMNYVERNTDEDIHSCYGDGLPW